MTGTTTTSASADREKSSDFFLFLFLFIVVMLFLFNFLELVVLVLKSESISIHGIHHLFDYRHVFSTFMTLVVLLRLLFVHLRLIRRKLTMSQEYSKRDIPSNIRKQSSFIQRVSLNRSLSL
ncbi:hypothetical protein HanRHA438_Chr05g0231191 [Helianthus annuus]|nr:hypothetical protein HanRHA438_Chr05g0231191 [Helianthus annuus]